MKSYPTWAVSLLALPFVAAGCGTSDDVLALPVDDNPVIECPKDVVSTVVYDASKAMSLPFFAQVNSSVGDAENFMVSPLSLTEVLAMLANGAQGTTQKQILKVMNIDTLSSRNASLAIDTLNQFLLSADKTSSVAIANSQWFDEGFSIKDSYVQTNDSFLSAQTYRQKLNTVQTKNAVNDWCSKHTNGCIPSILDSPYSDDTKVVLINALYFKGAWQNPFQSDFTTVQDFTNYDGSKSEVDMMRQTDDFLSCVDDDFAMVEFPYGNGSFCMDVILPNEGVSLNTVLKSFDNAKFDDCLQSMRRNEVFVSMPRLELKYRRMLNADLKALGMSDAFNSGKADFSLISDDPLFVSYVEQVTFLKVNEEGTEAAAVTSTGMCTTSLPTSQPLTFNMNRPYAFLIRERQTGIILFIGRVVKQ